MERCAPEVWVEILRRIGGSKAARNRSLKAASLAFKALTPYAQVELFRCISIKTVSDAERLLATFTSNRALQRCIVELKLELAFPRDKDPLYQWLLLEPNLGVLASFTRVTRLEIESLGPAPDVQTIISIFSHFKAVKHLRVGDLFEYNDFKQVAALFSCLGATLQHLDINMGIAFEDYEASEIDDIPSKLSAETLSRYTPQDALPHLESLKFYAGMRPEFIEWFFRSGVVDRIRTFELDPEISQDLEYTALLLSRGCRRLECLTIHMISEGWEGIDTSIAPIALPAHLQTVRFLTVGIGYEAFLEPILATLPEQNTLKHVDIITHGDNFQSVTAALDDLLSERRFRNLASIHVSLDDLEYGMSETDYAQHMPLALERGIVQITTVKSIFGPGGDSDDDDGDNDGYADSM